MKVTKQCSECGGREIYTTTVSTSQKSNNILPHIGGFYSMAELEVYVCGNCGHHQTFLPNTELAEVKKKYERYE